ncbi:unnamed protein product [Pseudo-nitzschia multistriata]|uniref:Uncharacterized protein n=1 Tax=Pseudo-nitzschia multistriata TaxID=183589 RepID=A0A448Z4P1_9STRA|nr:unnamed protein product [Pseudo-nitzschia multistriata]
MAPTKKKSITHGGPTPPSRSSTRKPKPKTPEIGKYLIRSPPSRKHTTTPTKLQFIPYDGTIQRELRALERVFPPQSTPEIYDRDLFAFKPKYPPSPTSYMAHLTIVHTKELNSTDKLTALGDNLQELLHRNHFKIIDKDTRYHYSVAFIEYMNKVLPPTRDTPPEAVPPRRQSKPPPHLANSPDPPSREDLQKQLINNSPQQETTSDSESSISSMDIPPSDLIKQFAREHDLEQRTSTEQTQQAGSPTPDQFPLQNAPEETEDTSLDDRITEYEKQYETIDNEISSIRDSLDPPNEPGNNKTMADQLKANDDKWTKRLTMIDKQILQLQEGYERVIQSTAAELATTKEVLTTTKAELNTATTELQTALQTVHTLKTQLQSQTTEIRGAININTNLQNNLNAAATTTWALDQRTSKANSVLASIKNETIHLRHLRDEASSITTKTPTIITAELKEQLNKIVDQSAANLKEKTKQIELQVTTAVLEQTRIMESTLESTIQDIIHDKLEHKAHIVQSLRDTVISQAKREIVSQATETIKEVNNDLTKTKNNLKQICNNHLAKLTSHKQDITHEMDQSASAAQENIAITKHIAEADITRSVKEHLETDPSVEDTITTQINSSIRSLVESTDFKTDIDTTIHTYVTQSPTLKDLIQHQVHDAIINNRTQQDEKQNKNQHISTDKHQNPIKSTTRIPSPFDTRGDSDRNFDVYTDRKHQIWDEKSIHYHNHRISKAIHAMDFKDINHNLIPTTNRYLTSAEFTAFYNELYGMMQLESLPLVPLDQLPEIETCIPPEHKETTENISKIGAYIYRRISGLLPPSHTLLRGLISPYSQNSRGYEALYALARHSLDYLKPTQNGWGPEWTTTDDPGTYVGKLQDHVRTSRLSRNHQYTEFEESHDLVYQAMTHFNYTAGCCLLVQLDNHRRLTPNFRHKPVPEHLKLTALTNFILDHPNITPIAHQQSPTIVNKLDATKRTKFEYKNKVQCECCKTYGHNVGDQICRFGAQLHYAQQFASTKPTDFKMNAIKHNNMHTKKVVNHFESTLKDRHITEEEHERKREELAQLFATVTTDE